MPIQRITIDVDLLKFSFAEQHEITGAIATLQRYGATPHLHVEIIEVAGIGRTGVRKTRVDKKALDLRTMQPQTRVIWDYLRRLDRDASPQEIAAATKVGENSVRGQLHILLKRDLVMQKAGKPKRWAIRPGGGR